MKQVFGKFLILTIVLVLTGSILIDWPAADIRTVDAQTLRSNSNAAQPLPTVVDDFVPEFVNLPNFGETDEEATSVSSRAKLIDISEFQSPEEQWPSYSKEEITVRSGEVWLGLYGSAGELFFANTKVARSDRKGYIGPGDQAYDWLKYERKGDLVFIVKGLSALRPGRVTTLYWSRNVSDDAHLDIGFRRSFKLNEKEYTLRVTTGLKKDREKANVLVLESEGTSQIITFNHYYKDHNTLYNSIGKLLWMGDLDGDGKLDLYLHNFGYEKGGFSSSLFLSSEAENGKLVKEVAGFGAAGC